MAITLFVNLIIHTMKFPAAIMLMLVALQYANAQNNDIETLKQINLDLTSSVITRDTAVESRIFADDMILTNPAGESYHKKELLERLISPGQECLSAKVDTVNVRVIGNTSLVSAKVTAVVRSSGKTNTVQTCYLDVYEKRKGRWYEVAAQVTLLSLK